MWTQSKPSEVLQYFKELIKLYTEQRTEHITLNEIKLI